MAPHSVDFLPPDVLRRDEEPRGSSALDPGVSQDHLGGQALPRVLDQESRDQVLGLGRDVAPLGLRELVAAVLDGVEEQLLTTMTRFALRRKKCGK